jgi:hypothetical protein
MAKAASLRFLHAGHLKTRLSTRWSETLAIGAIYGRIAVALVELEISEQPGKLN